MSKGKYIVQVTDVQGKTYYVGSKGLLQQDRRLAHRHYYRQNAQDYADAMRSTALAGSTQITGAQVLAYADAPLQTPVQQDAADAQQTQQQAGAQGAGLDTVQHVATQVLLQAAGVLGALRTDAQLDVPYTQADLDALHTYLQDAQRALRSIGTVMQAADGR